MLLFILQHKKKARHSTRGTCFMKNGVVQCMQHPWWTNRRRTCVRWRLQEKKLSTGSMMLTFLSMSLEGGARIFNIETLHTCIFYVSKCPPPLPLKTMHNRWSKTRGLRDLQIGCYGNQGHLPPSNYLDDDHGWGDWYNKYCNLHFGGVGGVWEAKGGMMLNSKHSLEEQLLHLASTTSTLAPVRWAKTSVAPKTRKIITTGWKNIVPLAMECHVNHAWEKSDLPKNKANLVPLGKTGGYLQLCIFTFLHTISV